MQRPDILLLDEPETHLDSSKRERLEGIVDTFDGAVFIVSHDRYFLDRTADRILEVRDGGVLTHEGGYTAWRERMSNVVDIAGKRARR